MKLLITGASGFIGNYFLDNHKDKYNIQIFSFLNDNFDDLDLNGVDTIIHLSALVHQMGGASEDEYDKVNVVQTLDLARKAKENGVKHFIIMSTIKVYGEETDIAYTESSDCNPQDDYGKSKLRAEIELQKLEDNNFLVSIIRTPIVYGYGVKANIKNLVGLVRKVPVLPFGNIQNRRSMVYVGNLCYFIDAVVRFPVELRMTGGRIGMTKGDNVFLVCDEKPLSTTRLVELIAESLGKRVYLVKIPFFANLLKLVKPSFYKRLYGSLEVDNRLTMTRLFGEAEATLPFSVENGVGFMIGGEEIPNQVGNDE